MILMTTQPFDHQGGGDYPGSRGIVIEAKRPNSDDALSTTLPALFVADNGDIDMGEHRVPAEDLLLWFERAAELIRAHTSARILRRNTDVDEQLRALDQ